MADPDPISSLFKLSVAALIDHVKEKKVKISPAQIPPSIHKFLWENSTGLDLIINTCHPETCHWFSTRVIRPPVMSAKFVDVGYGNLKWCHMFITFENQATIKWELGTTEWTGIRAGSADVIRTGNQYLSSVICGGQRREIISTLPHYDRTKFEVINWLCKVFRCEINHLELRDDRDELMIKWPKLTLAHTLIIRDVYNSEAVMEVVAKRQERGLRTTLENFKHAHPIQIQLLKSIDFKTAHLDLTNLTVEELIEFFRDVSSTACWSMDAETIDLTKEDLKAFKSELKLCNFLDMPVASQRRRLFSESLRSLEASNAFDFEFRYTFFSWQEEKVTEFRLEINTITMTVY